MVYRPAKIRETMLTVWSRRSFRRHCFDTANRYSPDPIQEQFPEGAEHERED